VVATHLPAQALKSTGGSAMQELIEMRRHPRQEVFNVVMVARNRERHSAMALDLSESGTRVGLIDGWTPPVGAALQVFFLFYTEREVVLLGHVTRVAGDHLGVEFAPEQEKSIHHLLEVVGKRH